MTKSILAAGKFAALLAASASFHALCIMHFRDQSYSTYRPDGGRTDDVRQIGGGEVRWTGGSPDQRIRKALAGRIGNNVLTGGWLDVPLTDREFQRIAGEAKLEVLPDGNSFEELTRPLAASWQRPFSCPETD
jgi:hypothetical protein